MASSAITLSGYCQASRLSPSPYAQRLNAVQPLPTSPTSTAMVATTMALVFIAFPPFRSLDESDYSVFLYRYPPSHPWSVGGEPRNTDFRLCRKVAHAPRPVTAGGPPAGRDALRGRASRPRSQASIVELYVLQTTGIFVTTDTGSLLLRTCRRLSRFLLTPGGSGAFSSATTWTATTSHERLD